MLPEKHRCLNDKIRMGSSALCARCMPPCCPEDVLKKTLDRLSKKIDNIETLFKRRRRRSIP